MLCVLVILWKYPLLRMLKQCCLKVSLSKGRYFSLCVVKDQFCYFSQIFKLYLRDQTYEIWKYILLKQVMQGKFYTRFVHPFIQLYINFESGYGVLLINVQLILKLLFMYALTKSSFLAPNGKKTIKIVLPCFFYHGIFCLFT